ncbi:MAG: tripartite tricarboxylate transporter TctB family protein [Angelakisella sp.]|nr:tripartite tricarboxylate transporter TctB family protein [Angelakisella sp.]
MRKKEIMVATGFLCFSIVMLALLPSQIQARQLTAAVSTGINLTPRSFPQFTLTCMLVLSSIHLISSLIAYAKEIKSIEGTEHVQDKKKIKAANVLTVVLLVAGIYLYVYMFRKLGFIVDTMIFCFCIGLYLKSTKIQLLISCIIIPVFLQFLFGLMYIRLPLGVLGFLV